MKIVESKDLSQFFMSTYLEAETHFCNILIIGIFFIYQKIESIFLYIKTNHSYFCIKYK